MITQRGTTPTFILHFPQAITNYDTVLVTFAQNKEIIVEKDKLDLVLVSGTDYSITFTEDEINGFKPGIFECQARIAEDGVVSASKIHRGRIEDVLNDDSIGG